MSQRHMIISRAPLRISFGGGGTDLPSFYERYGGLVISTTINHHVYAILTPSDQPAVQIVSADFHTFWRQGEHDLVWNGDLALPRAILTEFDLHRGLDIFLASQVPPGTGLGSSGSTAVCLINGLSTWKDVQLRRSDLAEQACWVEIEKMGMPVGKQDQYASTFGGLNCIRFGADGVTVEPIHLSEATRRDLNQRLLLFFTGRSRESSSILQYQKQKGEDGDAQVIERLQAIKELGLEIRSSLLKGELDALGELLHRSWLQKRSMAPNITNTEIDRAYELARSKGAIGGKITGAGGGGFLLLYCPEKHQDAVVKALGELGMFQLAFSLDMEGAQIIIAGEST